VKTRAVVRAGLQLL